jgi:hypothetical protein
MTSTEWPCLPGKVVAVGVHGRIRGTWFDAFR